MYKFLTASLAATFLTAVPALAQDTAAPMATTQDTTAATPAEAAANSGSGSFRGFRLEGNFGGDRFQSQGVHRDKFGYGATVGFDGQLGERFVVGPEATYWRSNDWTENCTGAGGGTLCTKSFQEVGVGVRAGYQVTPQFLVFGKGGYVTNEQRKSFSTPLGTRPVRGFYDHYNTDGYQLGGGVEYGMGNRFHGPLSGLYVSAQYVYSQYSDHTSRQRVMGGVGIRFK